MKLSIRWIFDHIDADWKTIDVADLVAQCNQKIAEIEKVYAVSADSSLFSLVRITELNATITAFSAEWNSSYQLPLRSDASLNSYYLIKKTSDAHRVAWAGMKDLLGEKEHLIPALRVIDEDYYKGSWKKSFEGEDYILELDNKSITHRPDLWGHRGFAREVATLLQLPLKPLQDFIVSKEVKEYESESKASHDNPYVIVNKAPRACKRFAGLYIASVEHTASSLAMAHRLCRVDARPIDMWVDVTNYVMLDVGQPMHAYDATTIKGAHIGPRFAHAQEKLLLLDGTTIELSPQDLVIADTIKPLGLAGIMGGVDSSVTTKTRSLFIESACFDATTIRLAAMRHKLRTEASARFEKSLDPHQTTQAVMRLLYIVQQEKIPYTAAQEIVACGKITQPPSITITHDFIERRLGIALNPSHVRAILQKLAFGVTQTQDGYVIEIPTFRATKDIAIKEDIVEEVGRYSGYTSLSRTMPAKQVQYGDLRSVMRVRTIKKAMAYGLHMRELYNYALYDEEFLRVLQWDPGSTVAVKNPISEHWRRLVTSLVPHLIKAIQVNSADHATMNFFEWARTWHLAEDGVREKKILAGIIFDQKQSVDFYHAKMLLQHLWDALDITVTWHKVDAPEQAWFRPYQTADLMHNGLSIGRAGKVNPLFLQPIAEGDAFIFELDGDFLLSYKAAEHTFTPLSKYPEVIRDISVLVNHALTADYLIAAIRNSDSRITSVLLLDFFEKEEWHQQRALTFRCTIQDMHKTLTKEEVEAIIERVYTTLRSEGATIR